MDKKKELKPFFSKFLEVGLTREELLEPCGGKNPPTSYTYPSDGEEAELRGKPKRKP